MPMTLGELARLCGAVLEGDAARLIRAASSLAEAGPDEVAPYTDPRYAEALERTRAAAVFVATGETSRPPAGAALLKAEDAELAFIYAVQVLHPERPETPGVDARACIEPGASLGCNAYIGPFAVVRAGASLGDECRIYSGAYVGRDCRLGPRCRLYPNVVLYDGVELGREVIIHSGSVIGADGFGYKFRDGRHLKVPQVGSVRIGDGVEIGANSCVDRAALGSTLVGEGTKIDNFVQIAHNVRVGRHVILCGQAAAAGSCAIEDYAVLGARAGLADHARVGQGARIAAAAGISGDVPPRATFLGYWAQDRRAALRELAAVRKLPDLLERLHRLELRVRELEGSGPPLLRERK